MSISSTTKKKIKTALAANWIVDTASSEEITRVRGEKEETVNREQN